MQLLWQQVSERTLPGDRDARKFPADTGLLERTDIDISGLGVTSFTKTLDSKLHQLLPICYSSECTAAIMILDMA